MRLLATLFALALSACSPLVWHESTDVLRERITVPPRADTHYGTALRVQLRSAHQCRATHPQKATVLLLSAARELAPHRQQSHWAESNYNQALGLAAELIQHHHYWGRTLHHQGHSVHIAETSIAQMEIDTLTFAGSVRTPALAPEITRTGQGVSMIAHSCKKPHNVFTPKSGLTFPVTLTADWSQPATVSLHLEDSRNSADLATNFSLPLALSEDSHKEFSIFGILNVFRPQNGFATMGLTSHEPIDPQRIPLILVHGLAASPNLWTQPAHTIMRDTQLRDRYQIYTYFYPTGLPLAHSAAGLKREIRALHSYLRAHGAGDNAEQMVVIGHSMGGLLTSAVTRDYRGAAKELYTKNFKKLSSTSAGKSTIQELLYTPPLTCISRAVFIATPHRGSKYASHWIGRFTSSLIKLPQDIISIDPNHYAHDLTRLGRSLISIDQNWDGVQLLRYNNPTLTFNLSRPKLPQVRYHSIIGNRGWWLGSLENSTDGVVTYASSHLDNADSECIVPAWHNAQDNTKAQQEVIRILQIHLKTKP